MKDILSKFDTYLKGNSKAEQTRLSYVKTIEQFLKIINKKPKQINKQDLEKFKQYVNEHYGRNTLTPKYSAINTFMKFLGKSKNWRDDNKLQAPPQETPNKIVLTPEEIVMLFKASEHNPRDNAIIKVFYYGLLRRSEVRSLNLKDIRYQEKKLNINNAKGNRNDIINIHSDAIESIKKYLKVRKPKNPNDNALFINRYGKRIGNTDLKNTIKRYAVQVGITKRVYPHLMRISGITHMHNNGANIGFIKRQSRHKDIPTLMGYIQSSDKENDEVYNKTISLTNQEPKQQPQPAPEKQPQKPIIQEDNTDKYIALLQERKITSEEFKILMTSVKPTNTNYIQ